MYLCCGRNNNNILGRAKTEKEAQKMCDILGSSYIKTIPILFWFMKRHNRFYIYNTMQGFLSYNEIIKEIKKISKIKYNKIERLSFKETSAIQLKTIFLFNFINTFSSFISLFVTLLYIFFLDSS